MEIQLKLHVMCMGHHKVRNIFFYDTIFRDISNKANTCRMRGEVRENESNLGSERGRDVRKYG